MNIRKEVKKLIPMVRSRIEALPPEFTEDLKAALVGAELMFRVQGGCAPIMEVWTTEDGQFSSPVPDEVQSYDEIRGYMWSLLQAKPGATAVQFAFTSTPQGGGSKDGRSLLNCLFMTRHCFYEMRAEITGVRSLGEWMLNTYPRPTGD